MKLLLTRMGSHLYGNSHVDSDKDFYCVTSMPHPSRIHKKTRVVKHMSHRYDLTEMDLSTFAKFAFDGIPQALEAMYAPDDAVLVDKIRDYRKAFRPSLPAMRDNYRSVIRNHMSLDNTPKQRFHALRLSANFYEAHTGNGRFNPRLTEKEIEIFTFYSQPENYKEFLAKLETLQIQ